MTGVPNGAFGYTAFVIDAYAGLIPGWECSLSRNGSCCAGTGMRWPRRWTGAVAAVGAAVARL